MTPSAAPTSEPTVAAPPLVAGRDFYFERGRFVLTAEYLLRRGTCCGNGCRHCPYRKPLATKATGSAGGRSANNST